MLKCKVNSIYEAELLTEFHVNCWDFLDMSKFNLLFSVRDHSIKIKEVRSLCYRYCSSGTHSQV